MDIGCYQAARDSAVHFQKLARWEDVNVDVTEPGRELQHRTAGLAVMKSTKFEFVINLKTAKTLVLKYSRLCLHAQTRRSNEHDDEAARFHRLSAAGCPLHLVLSENSIRSGFAL